MRKKTHFLIARIAINNIKLPYSGSDGQIIKRLAFYIGSTVPDLSVNQFIHPHYYEKSYGYVFDKLNLIMSKPVKNTLDVILLGEMVHYLCDFCCFAHMGGSIGKATEHITYERKIHKYLLKNQQSLLDVLSFGKYVSENGSDQIVDQVKSQLSRYRMMEPSYAWDIVNTLFITSMIYRELLRNKVTTDKYKMELVLYDGGSR